MSLIAGRINDLIRDARNDLNPDRVQEIANLLRCTGRYDTDATRLVTDVLAANVVLSGPDADNARYLSRQS